MACTESPSLSVSRGGHAQPGSDPLRTVVWLRGEHDIATLAQLSVTITYATRLDDGDLVVDLSGVTFMDASTIGTLVVARDGLRVRSRSLSVRAPSPRARRLLNLCGLAALIEDAIPAPSAMASALGSWIDVPALEPIPDASLTPVAQAAPCPEPARATAPAPAEPAGSLQQQSQAPL